MVNISVVIPTLNEEENLPNCLNNIVPQLRRGDELIIIDGDSKDNTREIAKEFCCTVYVNKGESTIGKDRNIGVDKSNNEVIATLDADSLPPKGWLDRVRAHFEQDRDLAVLWGSIEDLNGVPVRNLIGKFSTIFRGASGNNTAFRKEYFYMTEGYPDVSFMEDSIMIERIAKVGKAKRDSDLIMVMNMDRVRYQTVPIVATGAAMIGLSRYSKSYIGDIAKGVGAGLVGTESIYEGLSEHKTGLHHDMLGAGISAAGNLMGEKKHLARGLGTGVAIHHALTEGVSVFPTELNINTDEEI